MTYEEAQQKLLTVRWKTKECTQSDCWCSAVVPEEDIVYNNGIEGEVDDYVYIAGAGALTKELAEHIVKIHNESLERN